LASAEPEPPDRSSDGQDQTLPTRGRSRGELGACAQQRPDGSRASVSDGSMQRCHSASSGHVEVSARIAIITWISTYPLQMPPVQTRASWPPSKTRRLGSSPASAACNMTTLEAIAAWPSRSPTW